MMKKTFYPEKNSFKKNNKRLILQLLFFILLSLFTVMFLLPSDKPDFTFKYYALIFLWLFFLIIIVFIIVLLSKKERMKKLYESYKLTIIDGRIIRETFDTPTIEIPFDKIKSISKTNSSFSFVIQNTTNDHIFIPYFITKKIELEKSFAEIKNISKSWIPRFLIGRFILIAVMLISLALIYTTKDKKLIILGASVCIIETIYIFIIDRNNKNFDSVSKRYHWVSLVIIINFIWEAYNRIGKL